VASGWPVAPGCLGATFGGAGKLPESAGQATMAQSLISFADLRRWPGASVAEREWIASRAGQPGWLTGIGAGACDATLAQVVAGSVDWQAADAITDAWIAAYGPDGHREPYCRTCGDCTCVKPSAPSPP